MRTFIPGMRSKHVPSLFLSALLCLATTSVSFSQSSVDDMKKSALESTLPVVVMPSPNSAVLTRNISENVDLYTGRLSVDIPLYTLKSRDISLPISLQTVANAHKVNDVGTWIGLGWNLNAGGVITRVMKNLPDEWNGTISPDFPFHGVGYLKLKTAQEDYKVFERFEPVVVPYAVPYSRDEMKNIINRGNWNTKKNHPDKGYDLQPDEFFFNFGKYSGKFVFNQDGKILLTTAANLQITPVISDNKITAFTVKTDDGYSYEFGNYALNAVEETMLTIRSKTLLLTYRFTGCGTTGSVSVDGQPVNVQFYVYEQSPYVMSKKGLDNITDPSTYVPNELLDFWHPENYSAADYPNYPSSWYLTKIVSPTGDAITLNYVNNGIFNYKTERSWTESHPQFIEMSPLWNGCNAGPGFIVFQPPYFKSPVQPAKLFGAPDVWHYPSFGDVTTSSIWVTHNSKRLKEIVTSNGYSVKFIANTPRPEMAVDKLLDKISIEYNGNIIKEYLLGYETVGNTDPQEPVRVDLREQQYYYESKVFIRTQGRNATRSELMPMDPGAQYRSFLKSVTETGASGETVPSYKFDYYDPAGLPFRTSFKQDKYGYAKDNSTPPVYNKLLAGVLKSVTYPTGGVKEFTFEVSGNSTTWNGLRIKSVVETESSGAVPIVKNYAYGPYCATDFAIDSYSMPDVVASFPKNGGTWFVPIANKINISHTSRVNPANATRGASGGYAWVEVSQFNNGTYRIEFTNSQQYRDEGVPTMMVSGFYGGFTRNLSQDLGLSFPFPQNDSKDWQRGLPVAEYYKNASGKNIQSTHYNYDFTSNAMARNHSLGLQVSKYRIDFGSDWNWMLYGRYSFYPNWQLLTSKAIRTYAADGINYNESLEEYAYDKVDINSNQFLFLRQTKLLSNSKKEQVVQRIKYPFDYPITNASDPFQLGLAKLAMSGVFNTSVEKYRYVQNPDGSNRRYAGGVLNKFHTSKPLLLQTFSLQPSATLTSFSESSTGSGSFTYDPNYKPVASFTKYLNSGGGVLEQSKESDVKESFIWDYNFTFPTAKVINASFDDIAYTSFETDDSNSGNWIIEQPYRNTSQSVTGKRSYYIGQGITHTGMDPNKTYILSYWLNSGLDMTVQGAQSTFKGPQINGWTYWEKVITGISSIRLWGLYDIDEVRLYPQNAQMVTYTYDPKSGITSECDANNRIVHYEYDGLQRLKLIKDAHGNITKTFDYNYKSTNGEPMWTSTTEKRCRPCSQNEAYHTDVLQVKQIDVNPNSQSYKRDRWIDLGVTGACTIQPDWQNISGPVCLKNANGYNTGIQRYVQKDMNPCSSSGRTRDYDEVNYTNCPSNEPVWQATEEYRCQPCLANNAYTNDIQERKWIDVNPSSGSYQRPEWRPTGVKCSVLPDWQYTNTPPRCKLNSMGLPNGYIEREKKDMNPCSNSFGRTEWFIESQSPSCRGVNAEIVYTDDQWDGINGKNDIYIRFYYDDGTDATVSNVTVTLLEEHYGNVCDPVVYERIIPGVSGHLVKLYEDAITQYPQQSCYINVYFYIKH